jgi:hypothetical protein
MISAKSGPMIQEQRSNPFITLLTRLVERAVPFLHEDKNPILFSRQTRLRGSTEAPFCNKTMTMSRSPYDEAMWSGVFPSYRRREGNNSIMQEERPCRQK